MKLSFRDRDQRARACRALLATAHLGDLWTAEGPQQEESVVRRTGEAPIDAGQRATLRAARAFWSDDETLSLAELLAASNVEAICSLCVAATTAPEAIDAWLTRTSFGAGVVTHSNIHAGAAALFDEARTVFAELKGEVFDLRNPADACALGALQMYRYLIGLDRFEQRYSHIVDNDEAIAATNELLGLLALQESERAGGGEPDS